MEYFEKTIDCGFYEVVLTNQAITYTRKDTGDSLRLYSDFHITVDKEEDGGKIEINFKDRWGSSMQFIHYAPSDLKGMFDFIARAYNVPAHLITKGT
jgi:hypothetical protein